MIDPDTGKAISGVNLVLKVLVDRKWHSREEIEAAFTRCGGVESSAWARCAELVAKGTIAREHRRARLL